ncbi:hypothetical protein SS1G_09472 [Sclerotinia sclerotiorum 1980 UF-70]|uniref:Uncharacterized protein n=1 Tax=Sclerotinia sclerotiorum (strain ATCC 18683 / 1980 / Ss-1) TaxID=665079 RepID=A7EVW3_SCLS1|nr:hypothetical protein SS1G_09472 [Sclerotinia sclerotiorum 1980 UF-70]EDN93605.1 hypothetical protein SS1G_09472 [Sclerotinia sclerotiorum 1980 UF-70]
MENRDPIPSNHNKHPSNINEKPATQPTTSSSTSQLPSLSPSPHSKPCTICHIPRDVLIRCQVDQTRKWHFVCTGKCWRDVSGGNVDGDGSHLEYRYGGMWKNKHEAVSAKIKGKAKERNRNRKRGESTGELGGNVGEKEEEDGV